MGSRDVLGNNFWMFKFIKIGVKGEDVMKAKSIHHDDRVSEKNTWFGDQWLSEVFKDVFILCF